MAHRAVAGDKLRTLRTTAWLLAWASTDRDRQQIRASRQLPGVVVRRRASSPARVYSCLGSGAMSGVLRPVGPQPVQTYWARRALVFGAAAMVLVIAVALIISGTSNGSTAQPNPPASARLRRFPTTSM